ncbi:hypothetical protein [Rhizorhabdus dicambivorans]|uniref:Uncharacterized protein n=1 Tax=Rhizorhabdus dicambivorans TaxID=1850238 RepID=A0A2A4G118_9SPHN|nr:hypothetical protein [Rhizorhabdus dicambivorans]ATE63464.1 hypothetical protein CMV14_02800 [Rhizorhabdus dicambivorans]PCE43683.1 hypothetical protein COO09_05120 [Rhizorhabdus dicambivorans]
MATKYLVDDDFAAVQSRSIVDEHMPAVPTRFVGEKKKTMTIDTGFGFQIETSVPPVAGLVEAFERLYELRALQAGWDSYGAAPVHRDVFKPAVELISHALMRCHPPFITALNTGGLKLAWDCGPRELELEIEPHGRLAIYFTNKATGEEREEEGQSFDVALIALQQFCRGE